MAEETKTKRGGKRPNSGRKPNPNSKKQIGLKLDSDLFEAFNSPRFDGNRGRYINEAVREKMERDGYINPIDQPTDEVNVSIPYNTKE